MNNNAMILHRVNYLKFQTSCNTYVVMKSGFKNVDSTGKKCSNPQPKITKALGMYAMLNILI